MLGIALAVVIFALVFIGAIKIAYQRRRRRHTDSTSHEVSGGTAIGYLPGYMPGIQQKAQRRDEAATELVDPARPRDTPVDLDSNTVHVHRTR